MNNTGIAKKGMSVKFQEPSEMPRYFSRNAFAWEDRHGETMRGTVFMKGPYIRGMLRTNPKRIFK